MKRWLLMTGLLVAAPSVLADPVTDRIGAAVISITGQAVQDIRPTPFEGIYEVRSNGAMFYTNKNADWVMTGTMLDRRDPGNVTNLTEASMRAAK